MFVGLIAARMTGCPLIVEINGLPGVDVKLYRPHNGFLLSVTGFWERAMYSAAKLVVGAPGYIRYVQDHFNVPEDRCCVAPLGVNTEIFRPLDRDVCLNSTGLGNHPTIVWSGQVSGIQGLDTLFDAAIEINEAIPESRILVVGDGLQRKSLEEKARMLGLGEFVVFLGRVSYDEVLNYLGCATVCVATFPGERGELGAISSLKIMTYLACGRPVVTSDMDEMGAVIRDAGAGDSVPPDDPGRLATTLISLLQEDESTWMRRCVAARRLAEQRTWRHKAANVAACLRKVLEQ